MKRWMAIVSATVLAIFLVTVAAYPQVANYVQGMVADGIEVKGNPVRIGGKDGAGLTQDIATDASGNLSVVSPPSAAACKTVTVNAQGTGSADVTVDATATGVSVMAALATRCGALILNSGAADMRCAPSTVTVTSTVGFFVPAGQALRLSEEGQQAWRCIRTTGTSTSASIAEERT